MSLIENKNEFLFTEKYRPSNLKDVILPDRLRKEFEGQIKDGQCSNMMLTGGAGIGKTTVARAIANMIDADLMYINASNENGIDTIRTKVAQFASTASMEGNLKVVLLDECLHEDELIRIGTPENWTSIRLSDFEIGKEYPVLSVNMETGGVEPDIGRIISEKEDEVFLVEFEDGRTIRSNGKHPFIVMDCNGNLVEKMLMYISAGDEIISI